MKKTLCVTLSMLLLITSMPFSTFAKDIVKSTETKMVQITKQFKKRRTIICQKEKN